MIDNDFTSQSGIKVNLKLVDAATLLNAVIAGKGPDVALSVGQGEPVNYALRGAAEDLTQFEDYKEVFNNFYPSSYEPYRFNGGIYAVPETQTYDVMFYRKDILDELGVKVPQTWQELIEILPVIQQNNMTIAMPSVEKSDLTGIYSMLYQNGGSLYDESHKKTLIDSESGVKAFQTYTKFFTNYGLPVVYDFVNRFRSGEMPLGIQDYSTYNTLVVFAPEIRGLWDFTLVPGTLKSDGTIDRSCPSGGICSLMLKQSDEAKKKSSWEFLKWWAKTDTQVNFGREMESVLGSSARYAAANREAFEQLSWSHEQIEALKEQRECTIGIPEIAGGYYTSRHVSNAVRKIVNQHEDPREAVLDYAITINKEIEKKRIEFGLDTK
jgi:ABC-type glycerol-3-phosphate transport system substrate-binding protein